MVLEHSISCLCLKSQVPCNHQHHKRWTSKLLSRVLKEMFVWFTLFGLRIKFTAVQLTMKAPSSIFEQLTTTFKKTSLTQHFMFINEHLLHSSPCQTSSHNAKLNAKLNFSVFCSGLWVSKSAFCGDFPVLVEW